MVRVQVQTLEWRRSSAASCRILKQSLDKMKRFGLIVEVEGFKGLHSGCVLGFCAW